MGISSSATIVAKDVPEREAFSFLATSNGIFLSGETGVFRVEGDPTVKRIVDDKDAASLDGSDATDMGPQKVLAVAALPDRIFYSVEESRYEGQIAASIMVLGTDHQ